MLIINYLKIIKFQILLIAKFKKISNQMELNKNVSFFNLNNLIVNASIPPPPPHYRPINQLLWL